MVNLALPIILITGGAGYIGSHAGHFLKEKGYQPVILDDFSQRQDFACDWAPVIKGDYGDEQVLDDIFMQYSVQAVMHFASFIEVADSVKDPLRFYTNNVAKTCTLLNVMRKNNINTLIFSSSAATYGTPSIVPIPEEHPKNPINPYGRTKRMIEQILEDAHAAYGLRFVALRYFNAAGARPDLGLGERHDPETHVIPLLLRAARTGKPFYVFGTDFPTPDGSCIRDYLHVSDLADAHWRALEHLMKGGESGCFNLGTGNGVSVKQMVNAVEQVCGTAINVVYADRRAGDPDRLVADSSKARTVFNWQPTHSSIEEIVRSALMFEEQWR